MAAVRPFSSSDLKSINVELMGLYPKLAYLLVSLYLTRLQVHTGCFYQAGLHLGGRVEEKAHRSGL